ncbi:hypothetical protein ACFL5B_00335 [Candidatus Latescibacterota bacterium]
MKIKYMYLLPLLLLISLCNCSKDKAKRNNPFDPGGENYKTYTLSVTIAGGGGATVTLSGSASDSQIADVNGDYSFTVAQGGNYTITPSKTDYTITPASQTFNNVTTDLTANFTASYSTNTYTISGTVTGADSVLVTLSGDASDSQVVATDGRSYSFTVAEGGNYTITPSKIEYNFTPASQTYSALASNQTQNYNASPESTESVDIIMVSIPTGSFEMGANDGEADEQPVHTVTY